MFIPTILSTLMPNASRHCFYGEETEAQRDEAMELAFTAEFLIKAGIYCVPAPLQTCYLY